MAVALVVFLFPYQDVSRLLAGRIGAAEGAAAFLSATAVAWIALCTVLAAAALAGRQQRLLRHTSPADGELPSDAGLRRAFGGRRIAIAVLGDPDRVADRGGPADAPWVMRAPGRKGGHVVVLPASALRRLRSDPQALDAALAHEAAHVLHGDLRLLVGFERILRSCIVVVPIAVAASIAATTTNDVGAGAPLGMALAASTLGKGSIVVLPVLVGLSIWLLRSAERFREALADGFATATIGEAPFGRAVLALLGRADPEREARLRDWEPTLYGAGMVAAFGFALGAAAGDLPSPFAFVRSVLPDGSAWRPVMEVAFDLTRSAIVYAGAFALAGLLRHARGHHPLADRLEATRLGTYAASAVIGGLITQAIPLACSAAPVFDAMSNIDRHDAGSLIATSLAEGACLCAACSLAGALLGAARRGSAGLRLVAGLLLLAVAPAEPFAMVGATAGAASATVAGVLALSGLWVALRPRSGPRSNVALAVAAVLAFLTIAGQFGLAGTGAPARALMALARAALDRGDLVEARTSLRRAARLSALSAAAPLALAKLEVSTSAGGDAAVDDAEAALRAPFSNDWQERFDALSASGAALLDRRHDGDIARAAARLAEARGLWDRDDRLDPKVGVEAFYNSAVAVALGGGDALDGLRHLATAVAAALAVDRRRVDPAGLYEPKVAALALGDPDLAALGLADPTEPQPETIALFSTAGLTVDAATTKALAAGVSREEAMRFLRWMVHRAAGR